MRHVPSKTGASQEDNFLNQKGCIQCAGKRLFNFTWRDKDRFFLELKNCDSWGKTNHPTAFLMCNQNKV